MFNLIHNLPNEILQLIFNLIENDKIIFLNKYYYNKYNNLIPQIISKGRYDNYVRDIIYYCS